MANQVAMNNNHTAAANPLLFQSVDPISFTMLSNQQLYPMTVPQSIDANTAINDSFEMIEGPKVRLTDKSALNNVIDSL